PDRGHDRRRRSPGQPLGRAHRRPAPGELPQPEPQRRADPPPARRAADGLPAGGRPARGRRRGRLADRRRRRSRRRAGRDRQDRRRRPPGPGRPHPRGADAGQPARQRRPLRRAALRRGDQPVRRRSRRPGVRRRAGGRPGARPAAVPEVLPGGRPAGPGDRPRPVHRAGAGPPPGRRRLVRDGRGGSAPRAGVLLLPPPDCRLRPGEVEDSPHGRPGTFPADSRRGRQRSRSELVALTSDYVASPRDHVVQFYDSDEELAAQVVPYLAGAVTAGGVAVVIATEAHREAFAARLPHPGGNIVWVDAAEAMTALLVGDRPARHRFAKVVGDLVRQAAATAAGRPVRAYGEIVALMWGAGYLTAALELEELWNELGREVGFSLYCAYPQAVVGRGRAARPPGAGRWGAVPGGGGRLPAGGPGLDRGPPLRHRDPAGLGSWPPGRRRRRGGHRTGRQRRRPRPHPVHGDGLRPARRRGPHRRARRKHRAAPAPPGGGARRVGTRPRPRRRPRRRLGHRAGARREGRLGRPRQLTVRAASPSTRGRRAAGSSTWALCPSPGSTTGSGRRARRSAAGDIGSASPAASVTGARTASLSARPAASARSAKRGAGRAAISAARSSSAAVQRTLTPRPATAAGRSPNQPVPSVSATTPPSEWPRTASGAPASTVDDSAAASVPNE